MKLFDRSVNLPGAASIDRYWTSQFHTSPLSICIQKEVKHCRNDVARSWFVTSGFWQWYLETWMAYHLAAARSWFNTNRWYVKCVIHVPFFYTHAVTWGANIHTPTEPSAPHDRILLISQMLWKSECSRLACLYEAIFMQALVETARYLRLYGTVLASLKMFCSYAEPNQ